ncbi:MAG: SseB family protein [Blautia sp.]
MKVYTERKKSRRPLQLCSRSYTGTSGHALTVVRRRMRENGQMIIAVEPGMSGEQMKLNAVQTADGNSWWAVFTSFEEELKGSGSAMSTFMTDIQRVLEAALSEGQISGVIINPWNRTLMLDKTLIRIILGKIHIDSPLWEISTSRKAAPYLTMMRALFFM